MSETPHLASLRVKDENRSPSSAKTYEGKRQGSQITVTVDGRPLNPRLDLWNHSPTGFEWGYGGSGPAQLAIAILADYLRDDVQAVSLHQDFKLALVAGLPRAGWKLTGAEIDRVLAAIRAERALGEREVAT